MKKTGFILCVLVACMLLLCASALAEESDFTIQNGVLTYYNGTDVEVVVPDGVTSIRSTAFRGNTTLQKITLPESMKEIGGNAFYGCTALEEVVLSEGLEIISEFSFQQCTSLREIIIPDTVTAIERYAFENCTALENITLGEGLESIGGNAFARCSSLKELTIPASVTKMEDCIVGCTSLEKVCLGDHITEMGSLRLSYGGTIPMLICNRESDTAVAISSWDGCFVDPDEPELYLKVISGNSSNRSYQLEKYTGTSEKLVLPDDVTSIADRAFYVNNTSNTTLKEIVMPKVTCIGDYAFLECVSLEKATVSSTLKEVGMYAFCNCEKLASFDLSSVEVIGYGSFMSCSSLVVDTVSANSVGGSVFQNCKSIKELHFTGSLTELPDLALAGCSQLTTITLPDTVTTIGESALSETNLQRIVLPSNLTSIGQNALSDCRSLKSLTIPASVTVLTNPITWSFMGTIENVVLPATITSIPANAFGSGLKTVYCYRNSYAAQWAIEGGYSVIYLDDFLLQDFTVISSTVDEILLDVGQSYDAAQDVMIEPRLENQTYTLQLTSSNTSVAKVTGTTVEALAAGEATITVSIKEVPDVTCQFTVTVCIPVEDFTLPSVVAYQVDELYEALMDDQSKVWIVPENVKPAGAKPILKWEPMYNGSLVTDDVQLGEYYDMKGAEHIFAGMYTPVTLTATAPNGVSRSCRLYLYSNITDLRVTSAMTMMAGETAVPRVIAYLDGSLVSDVPNLYTLTSSNTEIVSITEEGQLAAHKTGTATITVKATTGSLTKTITVSVVQGSKLPAEVKTIEAEAFMGSAVTMVIIPDGCTSIAAKAFADCTQLSSVTIPASVTEIAEDAFQGSAPVIHTTQGSYAQTYAEAHGLTVTVE